MNRHTEKESNYENEYYNPYNQRNDKPKKIGKIFFLLLLMVIIAVVLFVLLFFRIKNIEVIGNYHVENSKIMEIADTHYGKNILFIQKEKVKEKINNNRYLIYKDLYRVYPDQVYIHVFERSPVAKMNFMGVTYITDMEGMVLEQTEEALNEDTYITVKGLNLKNCRMGTTITGSDVQQIEAFKKVMQEIEYQSYKLGISECNIASVDNILLTSLEGYVIRLGDQTQMRGKIAAAKAVVEYLTQYDAPLGNIDVSSPIYPTYTNWENP